MNKKLKKFLLNVLPVVIGIALIWYSVSKLSPADMAAIKNSFQTANYWWVGLSLLLGLLSNMSRAYRWEFMLSPLGYKPKFLNSLMSILIAYLLNMIIPRAGELARATMISKYEKVPFEKAFGTIVSERVADVIILLGIILLAFVIQTELISGYLFKDDPSSSSVKWIFMLALGAFSLLFLKLLRKTTNPFLMKIQKFVYGLFQGVLSIFRMKKKWAFLFHTLFIWSMYILMYYAITFALPETKNLPFSAIVVSFVVGSLSIALTNGGLGTFPVFVASALTLYQVPENAALAFGWIAWTAQTLMIIVLGGLSFIILPVYNRKAVT